MRLIGLLCVLLILTGCGALDNSMLETADTIKPGSLRAGLYNSQALDVHKMLNLKNRYSFVPSTDDIMPQTIGTMGARVSFGILKNVEIIGKVSTEDNDKVSLKYRLPLSYPKLSVAIMPTYNHFKGHYPNRYAFSVGKDSLLTINSRFEDYKSNGYELPLLLTYKASPHASFSFSMKAAYYPVRYEYNYETHVNYSYEYTYYSIHDTSTLFMYGISANLQLSSRYFYIMPAIGFDYVYLDGNIKGLVSTVGLSYGFQIYPLRPINE